MVGFTAANTIFDKINVYEELEPWYKITETLALGLIGFKIGTELKIRLLSQESRFITIVLLGEAGGAFSVVFVTIFAYTQDFILAMLLGGIAMATAPAATVEVLRKLRAKGEFTTKIQWILAFDDVIAVVAVEALLVVVIVTLGGGFTISSFMFGIFQEIGLALLVGLIAGVILNMIVERMEDELEMMELTLGILIFIMGLAAFLETSVILTTMVVGGVVTNLGGDNYEKAGDLLEVIMSPIIMLFFILVGARVTFGDFNPFPIVAIGYLIARSVGVLGGTYLGAKRVDIPEKMKKSLGMGLLAQGGVALGLMTVADEVLTEAGKPEIGALIISTIIISTIFSEAIGAIGTELAVKYNGEDGKAKKEKRDTQWLHVEANPKDQSGID